MSDPFDFIFDDTFQFDPAVFGTGDGGVSTTDFDQLFRCLDGVESSGQSVVDELSVFPATPFSIFYWGESETFPMDVIPW